MRGRGYIRGSGSNRGSGSSYRTSSSYGMNRNHSNLRQDRYSDNYGSTSSNRYNSNSYGGGHSSSTGAGTYDSRNRDKYNHNSSSSLNRYNDSSHKRHYRDSSRDRNDDRKRSRQDDYRRGSSSGRGNRTPPPPPPPHTGVTSSSSGANYRGHTSSRSHRPTTTSSRNHDNHRNEVSSNTRHSGANQMKQRPILRSGYVSRPRGNLTSSNRGIRTTYRGSAIGRLGRRDPNELRRLRRVQAIKIVRGSSSFLRNRRVARRSKSPRSSHKKNSSDDEDEDDDDAHEKTADSNKDDNEEDWDSDAKEAAAPSTGPPKKRSSSKRQKSSTDMETKTDDDDIEENDDDENQNDNDDDDDDDDDDDEHDDNENDDGTGDSGENGKKEVKENADESSVADEGSKCGASTDKIKKKEPSSTKEEKPELIDIAGKPKKERLGTTSPMTKDGKAKKTSSSPSSSISKVIKNAKDTKTTSSSDKKKAKRITGTASGADKHDDDINKQTTRAPPTRLREDIRKSSRFIKLTCVHCRARCVTFKEYSYHLNSRSHKNALRQIAYRQKAHLLRLRASQRNAQREIEENAKETYESKFCHLCRLHYRQPKAKHQLSEHHKTMKKFLMPYCSPCHLAFKSPMLYETHRCSLEHIRNKARNADCDSSELSADDELGEIDLNKFLTVDSVGEIDDDDMDIDTLLAESETLESADGNRLSGANDDIKAYAPLGIQFVQKVEAIYCGLCKQHYPLTDDFDAFTKNHCQLRTHLKSYIRHKEEQRNLEKINIKEEINAAADELEKQAGEDTVEEHDREAELEDDEQGISKNRIGGTVNKIDEDADEEDDDNVNNDDSKANAGVDGHDAGQGEYEYVEANADDGEPSIDDITIEEEPNLEISKPHADDVKDESNTYDASSETDAANHKTWDQVDKDLGEILREIPSTDKDEEDDEDEGVLNIDIESEKPKTKELNGKNEKELKKTIKVELQTPPKQKSQRKSTVVVAKKGDTPKKSSASPHK